MKALPAAVVSIAAVGVAVAVAFWPSPGRPSSEEPARDGDEPKCLRLGIVGYFDGEWYGIKQGRAALVLMREDGSHAAVEARGAPAQVLDVELAFPMLRISPDVEAPDVDRPRFVFRDEDGHEVATWHLAVPAETETDDEEHLIVTAVVGHVGPRAPFRLYRLDGERGLVPDGEDGPIVDRLRAVARHGRK